MSNPQVTFVKIRDFDARWEEGELKWGIVVDVEERKGSIQEKITCDKIKKEEELTERIKMETEIGDTKRMMEGMRKKMEDESPFNRDVRENRGIHCYLCVSRIIWLIYARIRDRIVDTNYQYRHSRVAGGVTDK